MTVDSDPDIRRREAAAWFARLNQRQVEQDDVLAFSQWRQSPENAKAFSRLEAMWNAAEVLADDPEILALDPSPELPTKSLRSRWPKRFAAAAATVAAVSAVFVAAIVLQPETLSTRIGERRVIALADGSQMTLDTNTRVKVRLSDGERRIDLIAGQAFFDVEQDPARPFVVIAGQARVTALGTQFDVRREAGSARVVLVEGRVRVEDQGRSRPDFVLSPGQKLDASSRAQPVAADVVRAVSWTTGRIVFDHTPLAEATSEVNRYSEDRIALQTRFASARVSGAFDAGDVDGFLAALVDLYPVVVERSPNGDYVVRDTTENNS